MKLITRIMGICIAVTLSSFVAVGIMIFGAVSRSYQAEAYASAQQEAMAVVSRLGQGLSGFSDGNSDKNSDKKNDNVYLEYMLKKENDPYIACFQDSGEGGYAEIYNRTVFEGDFLRDLFSGISSYAQEAGSSASISRNPLQLSLLASIYGQSVASAQNISSDVMVSVNQAQPFVSINGAVEGALSCVRLPWEGRIYLIFRAQMAQGQILYRFVDITYVQERMGQLALYLALVDGVALLCAVALLFLILRKILKPLQELNDTARQIAEGQYDRRIDAAGRDEIGQLSENFNKMAAAVEQRTRHLEESEQRKTLFMGNLTHELKTPMTAISGYAQTLLQVKVSPEEQAEALQYIYEECGRLDRLSRKLMRLLELGQETELPLAQIQVKAVFEGAASSCRGMLEEKNLTLICQEQGEAFWMDEDLMRDAVINLIDNAAKASAEGGRIFLRAGADYIEVEDFGKGIPEKEREKILEPFYMVDKSRSRKRGGAGLGLALTAQIARIHHCQIVVESREGAGTVIRLQFV